MSRATLAVILSRLATFKEPDTKLEQYATPSEAAATILWDAHTRGLLAGRNIIDLGAGTGILGIGALILGANVTFVEKDKRQKTVIEENLSLASKIVGRTLPGWSIIIADAARDELPRADLVITNPPFGTKERHADTAFLEAAYSVSDECYSFHKTSTDEYLDKWLGSKGIATTERFRFTFSLGKTMRQHEKQGHDVAITCRHTRKDL